MRQEAGTIDVLFANAGGGEFKPLHEITEAHYHRAFDTNLKGTLFTVQKALTLLKDGASVILMGSSSATTGLPGASTHAASKAAIRNFARSWCQELAPRRIRVSARRPSRPMSLPRLCRQKNDCFKKFEDVREVGASILAAHPRSD